jgi:hypothetical protein
MNELVNYARQKLEEIRRRAQSEAQTSLTPEPETKAPFHSEPGSGRPLYWESNDGVIRRGSFSLLGTFEGSGVAWFGIEDDAGGFAWVREDRFRTEAQYASQHGLS